MIIWPVKCKLYFFNIVHTFLCFAIVDSGFSFIWYDSSYSFLDIYTEYIKNKLIHEDTV